MVTYLGHDVSYRVNKYVGAINAIFNQTLQHQSTYKQHIASDLTSDAT